MADQDRDGPSLELPSFGFRRKKRGRKARAAAEAESAPVEPAPRSEPEPEPTPEGDVQAWPEPEAQPERTPEPQSEPGPTPTGVVDAEQPSPAHTEPIPVAREGASEQSEPGADTSGQPLFADETPASATAVEAPEERVERKQEVRKRRKPRKPLRVGLGAVPGAGLTGVLVGLATVGLTWGSLRLCELVRGASSCGGVGLFVLLLILIAMIFLGAGLLRMFRVSDPGSTSFLAIGLLTVVALLFLVDLLFNWWMIIVIPCVTLLTYTLSSWVTTSFVDNGGD
jgi:hypothetical protein